MDEMKAEVEKLGEDNKEIQKSYEHE